MESTLRFEILNTIASGDFATVYRARDRELGREVAIKQIHPQFLQDPEQLDRYWQEAQLLASLQHPNILTIYDIVRSRGWLISGIDARQPAAGGAAGRHGPGSLRFVLLCGLNAPALSARQRDHPRRRQAEQHAGRRAGSGEAGRLRAGAAGQQRARQPAQGHDEVHGPGTGLRPVRPGRPGQRPVFAGFLRLRTDVRPAFRVALSAFATFGRDRQIAWMMWHAAPDRHLPEIARVLEGVPDDLAQVVERLVAKDLSQRYQVGPGGDGGLAQRASDAAASARDESEDATPAAHQRRRRVAVLCAVVSSLLLAAWMLRPQSVRPVGSQMPEAIQGIVRMIDADRRILVLDLPDGTRWNCKTLTPDDRFYVNDNARCSANCSSQDHVSLKYIRGDDGRRIAEVYATRPQTVAGDIQSVDVAAGTIAVLVGPGNEELTIRVPHTVTIQLNGQSDVDGRPVALADLCVGDRVTVSHVAEQAGRAAVALARSASSNCRESSGGSNQSSHADGRDRRGPAAHHAQASRWRRSARSA